LVGLPWRSVIASAVLDGTSMMRSDVPPLLY
jgi:hypothetical protein